MDKPWQLVATDKGRIAYHATEGEGSSANNEDPLPTPAHGRTQNPLSRRPTTPLERILPRYVLTHRALVFYLALTLFLFLSAGAKPTLCAAENATQLFSPFTPMQDPNRAIYALGVLFRANLADLASGEEVQGMVHSGSWVCGCVQGSECAFWDWTGGCVWS